MKSSVMIVPAAYRDAANAFAASRGWQEPNAALGTFLVRLSSDGTTVSHYGCRPNLDDELLALLAEWQTNGAPPAAAPILAVMQIEIAEHGETGLEHFLSVIGALGLTRLESNLP